MSNLYVLNKKGPVDRGHVIRGFELARPPAPHHQSSDTRSPFAFQRPRTPVALVYELEQVHIGMTVMRACHPNAIAINAKAAERLAVGRRDNVQRLALQRQHLDAPSLPFANVESPVTYGDAGRLIELPGR